MSAPDDQTKIYKEPLSMQRRWLLLVSSLVIVVAVGVGIFLWQQAAINKTKKEVEAAKTAFQARHSSAQSEVKRNINQNTDTWLSYQHSSPQFAFKYPPQWKKVACKGRPDTVYLASDDRGVNIHDGVSALCGGGTDFAPQVYIGYRPEAYNDELPNASTVVIDGIEAQRSVQVNETEGLFPADFKTITYRIPLGEGEISAIYSRWPSSHADEYDTSDESEALFKKIIEETFKLR